MGSLLIFTVLLARILLAWVTTLPIGALLAALACGLLHGFA